MIVLRPSLQIRARLAPTTVRTRHDLQEAAPSLTIGLLDLRTVGLPPPLPYDPTSSPSYKSADLAGYRIAPG